MLPSKGGIGIMLNMKSHIFIILVKCQNRNSFFFNLFLNLKIKIADVQSKRLINGPAKAIMLNSKDELGFTETYPGANIKNGLPIILNKTPNANPNHHMLNIASYPNARPANLCPNSCSITAGAVTSIANLMLFQLNPLEYNPGIFMYPEKIYPRTNVRITM